MVTQRQGQASLLASIKNGMQQQKASFYTPYFSGAYHFLDLLRRQGLIAGATWQPSRRRFLVALRAHTAVGGVWGGVHSLDRAAHLS
jgi:ribosomal protein S8